jgi:hypothetical protein
MPVPSGDHVAVISSADPEVIRQSSPVWASTTQMSPSPLPARQDEKAILVPSGDQSGSLSRSRWLVI